MKKGLLVTLIVISSFLLFSCKSSNLEDNYNSETFGILDIKKDDLKILQLTDIHLTYGFDYLDRKTYKLIDKLILKEEPDIIVITGDLFMSVLDNSLFKQFIKFIEKHEIPWTITFGNHEMEYSKMENLVKLLLKQKTNYLVFHYGPKLSDDNTHGFSNFKIQIKNGNKSLVNLYLLDTKANRTDGVKDSNYPYNYLSENQVLWYKEEVTSDLVGSLAFMHIPLQEYLEYKGELGEKMWVQGKNTGFFQAIKDTSTKTKAVFVGHDHLNDFEFTHEGVLLAYGLSSGFNGYGTNEKGARVIVLNNFNKINFDLNTYLVKESEVLLYV